MVYLYFDKENSEKDDGTNKEGKLKIVKPISLLQLHDLNIAIRVNRQDLVTYILCQNEYLNLNSCLIRSPPIALAVQSRNPCVVKLLLDHGCDVNKLFEYEIGTYETPLNYACRHGDYEIVKLLLQHNADPNITNIDHCSPLLNAAREGFHEICIALIKYKANLNMPEKNGQTPLHMACKYFYRSYKSAEILIAHGAKSTQPDFKRRLCTDMICFSDSFTNEQGEEVLLIGQNFIEQKNVIGMLFDSETRPIRIYADGVFDLFHIGHAKLFEQIKNLVPNCELVVGVVNDNDSFKNKGCFPIMSQDERCNIVETCKHVDELIKNPPFYPTIEFCANHRIDLVAHDDHPYPVDGMNDCYEPFKESNRFLVTQREQFISTTDIVKRILNNYSNLIICPKFQA
uniref:Choline-phosphate cytidylyltransferase n=1 Tax=Rhabditophanes sp. KR3021 TaxID=114890 RepID=A0AC35U5X9_9BILA